MFARKSLIIGFLVVGVSAALLALTSASANPQVEIKNRSRDLDKVQEELNRIKKEQEQLSREASELSKSLQEHDKKLTGVESALIYTKERNIEVEMSLARSKNSRDRTSKKIMDTRAAVRGAFGTHYVMANLVGHGAPSVIYTRELYRANVNKLDQLKSSKEVEEQNFQELTSTFQVLQRELQSQENSLNQIRVTKRSQERLLQKKLTRQQIVEDEFAELQKSAQELASMIELLRSRARKEQVEEKKERLEKITTGHSPIQRASLPWPIKGDVLKKFGRQIDAEFSTPYVSNGITVRPDPAASPVLCVADGMVLYAGNFMSYGRMVVVEHPGDWFSVYGQLAKWNVEKGQTLKRGDAIGQPGFDDDGKSQAYFELRFYGKPVNPLPWLRNE